MSNTSDTDDDFDWDAASFVLRSNYRNATMGELEAGPHTPSEIATASGIKIAHISRALHELRDRGFVKLLVDEETHKGRYYGLTDEGRQLMEAIDDHV